MMENIENTVVEETMGVVENVVDSISYKEAGFGFVLGVAATVGVKLAKDHVIPKAKAFFGSMMKKNKNADTEGPIDITDYATVVDSNKEKTNK